MTDEHSWLHARAGAYRARLLDPEDAERIESHLAGCAECRDFIAELAPEDGPGEAGEHPPAALLARWPAAADQIDPLERELVERHVERCASCRELLALLGHSAATVDSPATGPAHGAGAETAEVLPLPGSRRRGREESRRPGFVPWLLGGWAAAATAAAILLALRPETGVDTTRSPWIRSAMGSRGIAASAPLIALSAAQRGSAAEVPEIAVDSLAPQLALSIPTQVARAEEARSVEIHVVGPDGVQVAADRSDAREWTAPRVLVLVRGTKSWRAGRYRVKLWIDPSPAALVPAIEFRSYAFTLHPAGDARSLNPAPTR